MDYHNKKNIITYPLQMVINSLFVKIAVLLKLSKKWQIFCSLSLTSSIHYQTEAFVTNTVSPSTINSLPCQCHMVDDVVVDRTDCTFLNQ